MRLPLFVGGLVFLGACSVLLDTGELSSSLSDASVTPEASSDGSEETSLGRDSASDSATDALDVRVDAGPLPIGLGNGQSDLTISNDRVVNAYAAVANALPTGSRSLTLSGRLDLAAAGSLVMVWQTGVTAASAATSRTLSGSDGSYELFRLTSVSGDGLNLTLDRPATANFANPTLTQVVLVAEYKNLTVAASGRVRAEPWNGRTGGIVVLFATGKVTVLGSVEANGAGFRGAPTAIDPAASVNCGLELEGTSPKYGLRGEGAFTSMYTTKLAGRGRASGGGGGGNCHDSGGGGGGHSGRGGKGGDGWVNTVGGGGGKGGEEGASSVYALRERFTLGGGGGAGHTQVHNSSGANGGGALWIRANAIEANTGTISANGASAPQTVKDDGAGGGGAGGGIFLQSATSVVCSASRVQARGGNGGITDAGFVLGPGGGGGGGLVRMEAASLACIPVVLGAAAATCTAPGGGSCGATAGAVGAVESISPAPAF